MEEGGVLPKNRYDEVGAHPRVPASPLWASCVHSCLSYWSVSTPGTFPPPQHLTLFSAFFGVLYTFVKSSGWFYEFARAPVTKSHKQSGLKDRILLLTVL